MVCRRKARKRVLRYLDKAKQIYMRKIKTGELEGKNENLILLTDRVINQLFFLMFQFQMIEFLQKKTEKKYGADFYEDSETSLIDDKKKLFDLRKIIKFKNTKKILESKPFFYLYNKIKNNCTGVEKLEDYIEVMKPQSKISRATETLKLSLKGEGGSTIINNTPSKLTLKSKKKRFFARAQSKKIKEGTFQEMMLKRREEEKKMIKKTISKQKFTKGIMSKIEKEKKSGFQIKVGKTFMFIAITTIIDYFLLNPAEFKDLGAE